MIGNDSYVFQTLEFLASKRQRVSTHDVFMKLTEWRAAGGNRIDGSPKRTMPENEQSVKAALERLQKIGVVRSGGKDEQWELAVDVPNPPRGGGNGGDDNFQGGSSDSGDSGGGGGLSEVLSHPVLFCMNEVDQDNLIAAALGLSPEGMQA